MKERGLLITGGGRVTPKWEEGLDGEKHTFKVLPGAGPLQNTGHRQD